MRRKAETIHHVYKESEKWLSAVFDNTHDAILLVDDNGKLIKINPAAIKLLGYPEKELLSLTLNDIIFQKQILRTSMDLWPHLINGNEGRKEIAFKKKDGSVIRCLSQITADIQPGIHLAIFSDITYQKLVEKKLAYKNEILRSLEVQNPDAVFILDIEGKIQRVNNMALKMTGFRKKELMGRPYSEFCEPGEQRKFSFFLKDILAGQKNTIDIVFIDASHRKRVLNIKAIPLVVNLAETGIYVIARDFTDKRREEKEKELFNSLQKVFDQKINLKECLSRVLLILAENSGIQDAEIWVSNLDEKEMHPSCLILRKKVQASGFTEYRAVKAKGLIGKVWSNNKPVFIRDIQECSFYMRKPFAAEHDLRSALGIPVSHNQEVVAVIVYYSNQVQEIEHFIRPGETFLSQLANSIQRKKAEENMDLFFNLSEDLLCIAGTDGYFKKVNPAFSRLLGYSEKELLSRPYYEFVHAEDRFESDRGKQIIEQGKSIRGFENRYITKSGDIKWISWSAVLLPAEGSMIGVVGRDITEKKKLEKIVASEQFRFRKMFIEAPVSMCILKGEDHVFESANNEYYKLTNRKPDIIGKNVREVFPEVEGQGYFDWLDRVFETGETFSSNETPLQLDLNDDGTLTDMYLSFMYQPYRNESGQVEGIFYFGVNVTEQVMARKKIEESEKQYIELIQNLPAAVYTTDEKGFIKLFNKAAAGLWGREPEAGKEQWCGSWKLFDLQKNLLLHEECPMALTLKTGKPIRGKEVYIQKPDGEFRRVMPYPSPVHNINNQLIGAINVLIDITDLKKAEEELQKLSIIAKKTDNAVIITSPEGEIEWVNDAFTRITEYGFDEVTGRKSSQFLHGKLTNPEIVNYIKQKMKQEEPFECEILKYKKSGQTFWVEIKGQPIFNSRGGLSHYFEIETDITEKKNAYKKVVEAENQVRSFARQLNDMLEEERSRIAREIHDEFGQQLTGLKMSLTFLNKLSAGNRQIREFSESVKRDIENTIQSLREFATELRPGILDTLGLIASLEWLIKEFENKSGMHCEFITNINGEAFDRNFSICIFRICQEALTNILKHAKASHAGIVFTKNKTEYTLQITDDGRGIASEKLNNPFSMGLLGMRERANLINGDLRIESRPGAGTCILLNVAFNE